MFISCNKTNLRAFNVWVLVLISRLHISNDTRWVMWQISLRLPLLPINIPGTQFRLRRLGSQCRCFKYVSARDTNTWPAGQTNVLDTELRLFSCSCLFCLFTFIFGRTYKLSGSSLNMDRKVLNIPTNNS